MCFIDLLGFLFMDDVRCVFLAISKFYEAVFFFSLGALGCMGIEFRAYSVIIINLIVSLKWNIAWRIFFLKMLIGIVFDLICLIFLDFSSSLKFQFSFCFYPCIHTMWLKRTQHFCMTYTSLVPLLGKTIYYFLLIVRDFLNFNTYREQYIVHHGRKEGFFARV